MNTGQTMITLGALMFLTVSVLDLNGFIATHDTSLAQNQYRMEALSILNSYIKQASALYFDEAATNTAIGKRLSNFVTSANLGFDGNDNNVIDDFDDYHTLTISDTGSSGVPYQLYFTVDYVTLSSGQITTSSSRQYHKRMTITIQDSYIDPLIYRWENGVKVRETLKVSFVKSYWFYN
jgi:hypothetical protein